MNSLGLKKKKKKKKKNETVLCTFLSLFSLTTTLFSLTTVHGVCGNSFNYTFVRMCNACEPYIIVKSMTDWSMHSTGNGNQSQPGFQRIKVLY